MKLAACAALPLTPENGHWYRVIQLAHLKTALSSAHTKKAVSRFNAGTYLGAADQFGALYFADDPIVAQFEMGALLGCLAPGHYIPHPRLSFVMMSVHIILRDVADLTEVSGAQTPLETNAQELTGDWRGYQIRTSLTRVSDPVGIAPTQELGKALADTGIEGFRAISARVPYHKTLVVFTDNLKVSSSLVFYDPNGQFSARIDGTI